MCRKLLEVVFVSVLITLLDAADAAEKTPLQIDDLYRHDAVTDLVVLPGDKTAVYVREWAERPYLARRQSLWFVDGEPNNRRPVEADQPDGRRPILSPNGKWLAFLSTRPFPDGTAAFPSVPVWSEPATDVWLLRIDAGRFVGNPIPLAGKSKQYGRVFNDPFYGRVAFSPDSRRLAFVADDGMDRRTAEERELGLTIVREDQGEGYEGYGPASVWVAELLDEPGAAAATVVQRLTPNDAWYGDPQWLPDGKSLVVHANRTNDRESVRFSINKNYDLWRIDLQSGNLQQLTTGEGPQVSPRISPDGKRLVCLSVPRRGPHADVYDLELVKLGEQPKSSLLKDHLVGSDARIKHGFPAFPLPTDCWLNNRLVLIDTIVGPHGQKECFDTDQLATGGAVSTEWEIATRHKTEAKNKLTPPSNEYLNERLISDDEIVRWKSTDGTEIEGLLTLPPGSVASRPYKLLLYPHGGPHSRSTSGFNFTVQLFAANGYAVFQPNFRGSPGYSRKFLDADRLDLGGGDMQDILSGIEHLVQKGIVDPQRQFVYGISYGGFMTSWLIGHTNQFRAAVPQNAVTEMNVMWGVSDLQSWTHWELGGLPWEVPDRMRERSPFSHVHRVKTPTLVLHADHDRRCPLPMGQMFYRGLKGAGVETEMVVYHNERHGIWQLPHQADIYRRVLAWFAKHDVQ